MAETVYSLAVDGYIRSPVDSDWSVVRNANTGVSVDDSSNNMSAIYAYHSSGFNYHECLRSCFAFDLSELPSNASVISAELHIYCTGGNATVIAQQATFSGSLTVDDYDAFTGLPFGEASFSSPIEYKVIEFNAAGLSYVESAMGSDIARFCLREKEHDYEGAAPGTDESFMAELNFSESSTDRPKLIITYTTGQYAVIPCKCIDNVNNLWLVAGHEVAEIYPDIFVTSPIDKGAEPSLRNTGFNLHPGYSYSKGLNGRIAVIEFTDLAPKETDQVWCNVRGMVDGGTLIENPVDIMTHFITSYLGMTTTGYSETGFSTAKQTATDRTYKSAGAIIEFKNTNAKEILEDMAASIGATLFFNTNGLLSVKFTV